MGDNTNPLPPVQAEVVELVKRLREWAEEDVRSIANDMTSMGLKIEPGEVRRWGDLMDEAADLLQAQQADIAKYRARLEVDHYWTAEPGAPADQKMVRIEVPYVCADDDIGSTDGISCRDETIKLQDEHLKRLQAQQAEIERLKAPREKRIPYSKSTPESRAQCLEALLCPETGWPRDWEDRLGLDAKGSIIWQVNAADVMLLIAEIERLRTPAPTDDAGPMEIAGLKAEIARLTIALNNARVICNGLADAIPQSARLPGDLPTVDVDALAQSPAQEIRRVIDACEAATPAPTDGTAWQGMRALLTKARNFALPEGDVSYKSGFSAGAVAVIDALERAFPSPHSVSSATDSDVDGSSAKTSQANDWANKRAELLGWTGSAVLAGEEDFTPEQLGDLYSFMYSLIGYLHAGEDLERAANPSASPAALRAQDKGGV